MNHTLIGKLRITVLRCYSHWRDSSQMGEFDRIISPDPASRLCAGVLPLSSNLRAPGRRAGAGSQVYSYRKLSTGLAVAALADLTAIVASATRTTSSPISKKVSASRRTLYANPSSHFAIT